MTAVPGRAASKDAPVTPRASASSPFALGRSTPLLAWIGDHLRAGVPFRNTTTLVPRVTQKDAPLSAPVMVSLPWVAGLPPGHEPDDPEPEAGEWEVDGAGAATPTPVPCCC